MLDFVSAHLYVSLFSERLTIGTISLLIFYHVAFVKLRSSTATGHLPCWMPRHTRWNMLWCNFLILHSTWSMSCDIPHTTSRRHDCIATTLVQKLRLPSGGRNWIGNGLPRFGTVLAERRCIKLGGSWSLKEVDEGGWPSVLWRRGGQTHVEANKGRKDM